MGGVEAGSVKRRRTRNEAVEGRRQNTGLRRWKLVGKNACGEGITN